MNASLPATSIAGQPRRRWAIDRRLLWLVLVGAALVLGELSLRGWEAQQQLQAELDRVRSRAAVLAGSSDQIDWSARTRAAEAERAALQQRLWRAPSEAQAQARLRDWLSNALYSAGVPRPTVSLLSVQPALPAAANPGGTAAGTPAFASAASATALGASAAGGVSAIRVRATVGFDLAPKQLEDALLQIEAGGQLARIDSLTAGTRTRRAEMTVSVPVLIDPALRQSNSNSSAAKAARAMAQPARDVRSAVPRTEAPR